jgi:ribosomal protein S18 acetylase RimI-like enzyme
VRIRAYRAADEEALVALWQACELTRPWNDPRTDVARKLAVQADGLMLAELDGALVGAVMVGYDGHRGAINYLAVDPARQRSGVGQALMAAAERWLTDRGCPKINLHVRTGNRDVLGFYRRLGYDVDDVVPLSKRLIDDSR